MTDHDPVSRASHTRLHRWWIAAGFSLILIACLAVPASAAWHTTALAGRGSTVSTTSLAFNDTGPCIAYFDWNNMDLNFDYQDGAGAWHTVIVDSAGDTGYWSSLAFNATGPAIGYVGGLIHGPVKFAWQDGSGGWHTTLVHDTYAEYTSLAFNGTSPAISFFDYEDSSWDLEYAYPDGNGTWQTEIVEPGCFGEFTSLAFNATGPAICYYDSNHGEMKFSYRDGGGWHTVVVDTCFGSYPSLAFNATGPAFSYFDATHNVLKIANLDGNGWHTVIVDSDPNIWVHTALAFDGDGRPAISYYTGGNGGTLRFARQDGTGTWQFATVDSGGVGTYPSLAFNATGPAISYNDPTRGALKFAWLVPPPTVSSITPGHAVTGTVVTVTDLAGTGFYGTPYVNLTNGGSTINADGVTRNSSTNLSCTFTLAGATPGAWDIGVTNPDGDSCTVPGGFTVDPVPTTTAVSSSANPSLYGQEVVFTATVNATGTGSGLPSYPSGTVTFREGSTVLGTGTLAEGIAVSPAISNLSVGSHPVNATYDGDTYFAASSNTTLSQVVNKASTTVSVSAAPNPAHTSDGVTFTATVNATAPGAGIPTGVVLFDEGTSRLAEAFLADGTASTAPFTFPPGTYFFNVTYLGDENFTTSYNNSLSLLVINDSPDITTITPRKHLRDGKPFKAIITGTGFQYGTGTTMVRLTKGARTIAAKKVIVLDTDRFTCRFTIPKNAKTGLYNVTVINPDLQVDVLIKGFRVTG